MNNRENKAALFFKATFLTRTRHDDRSPRGMTTKRGGETSNPKKCNQEERGKKTKTGKSSKNKNEQTSG